MKKVVTINLNRHAYQVDEDAYELLHAYLEESGAALRDNPDREEIIADLEQAIAEKCQRFMDSQKSVVSAADVRQLLDEMGPVDQGAASATGGASTDQPPPGATTARGSDTGGTTQSASAPKRFYRIMDGAWLGGVCTGIAAYVNVDPTVVRVIWGLLALLDFTVMKVPLFTLAYLAVWSLLPEASTSEQRAAASGAAFNAHEIVEEAKRHYAEFRTGRSHAAWRQQRRELRRTMRRTRATRLPLAWRTLPPPVFGHGMRLAAGGFAPLLTFGAVLLFWLMAFVLLSLADTRSFYHWSLPSDLPLWVGLLGVVIVYHWIAWPLRMARRAGYYAMGRGYPGWAEAWDNLSGMAFTALILWFAYTRVPEVRDLVHRLPDLWHQFMDWTIRISTAR